MTIGVLRGIIIQGTIMTTYSFTKAVLASAIITTVFSSASAQETTPDDIEQLPNKKLEERGERIRGPITSIAAGALLFASYDKNADYLIDADEFSKGQAASFQSADSDKSGTLSLFELEDWRKAALGSLDAAPGNLSFDKDYDQRVTATEFKSALKYVYNVNDKDADNQLSFEEMIRVFEIPRGRRSGSSAGAGQREGRTRGNGDRPRRGGGRR